MTTPHILIVEDEIIFAEGIRDKLLEFGYDVLSIITSGKAAIQFIDQTLPDLILMDIKLKGSMDGIEAAEYIQARFDIPIVYLTAYADDDTLQRAKVTIPYGYVLKPVNLRELHTNIEMTLYKHATDKQIRGLLREKEILLRETHHRVKNNLQLIHSLLNLQSDTLHDPHVLKVLQESKHRIKSMAIIHEILCGAQNIAHLDIAHYINFLSRAIVDVYSHKSQEVMLDLHIDDVVMDLDMAISCGLLINELVTNALKYAFTTNNSGKIQVKLAAGNNGQFTLIVQDNGGGFPAEIDFRNASTLGLQLVNLLTRQLCGTITLDRNSGTAFTMTFPERKSVKEEMS